MTQQSALAGSGAKGHNTMAKQASAARIEPMRTEERTSQRDSQNPTVYGSLGISQHLNQGAANTFAGTVALAAGTATVTFPTAYNAAPVCTANDTSAVATLRAQTAATALTQTQSSGTDTFAYICVGNPNQRGCDERLTVPLIGHFPHVEPMHIPEPAHYWALFVAGHGLHVLKRASLSAQSVLSSTKTRSEWVRTNALNLTIRFFVNAEAFSY
jgi:hypothetical protein